MMNRTANKIFFYLKQPCYILTWFFVFAPAVQKLYAQGKPARPQPPISDERGKLVYTTDEMGNRVPDFSYCGYMASEKPIPDVPAVILVPLTKEDATWRIQSAIDHVSALPLDKNGFRGAVLLQKGTYNISGQLKIEASGVVLRGSGTKEDGTILLGMGLDRQTLIRIAGKNDRISNREIAVTDVYVPVNAFRLTLAQPNFYVGDKILIHRASNLKWIKTLGTETFGGGLSSLGWKPGERDIWWDRTIVSVNGNEVTLDAPITTALDTTYGGATVSFYDWPGRISNVGIENLQCRSTYEISNPKDEAHRWMAITIENAINSWVRQVEFRNFAGSAVRILETAKCITVEDCKSLSPVSEIGGQRRYSFYTTGQQTLIQRCYAENGYHDFAVGFCAAGPNAFVQCQAVLPYSFSGAIDSWASGVLFDIVNVDGNALRFGDRGQDGQGAGWTAANSVFWQCTAALVECAKPPTANNWAFGTWAQFSGNGYWGESNNSINPRSLYYAQLAQRLGQDVRDRAQILFVETNASSSPTVDVAMELTRNSVKPATTLNEWIDAASKRQPISIKYSGLKTMDQAGIKMPYPLPNAPLLQVSNGWLQRGDEIITGKRNEVQWWNGSILPTDLPKMKPHITRFVPGRTGTGLTDDLDEVTTNMKNGNVIVLEHNYALWYERRRDDHERIRRMDGEVWPPFYELPFARSGKESAWDGLSKYDLTKYNFWYWSRLKKFADLADQKGLVLVHQNYFQHNIIEAGAHYADFPWRTANNINNTGFPEPPPYAGDKRIFMADQFYDLSNPVRKKLHGAYIRKCLENFSSNSGVIQLIGAEFTGPKHFVEFWLNTIADWEKEKNKKEIIGLSTTKDVQDSILANPKLSAVVDLIDIRYWHYQDDGKTYEPKGGQNLAPRQHARLLKPKKTSFAQVYRAVSEYRKKYPSKAVVYSGDSYDQFGWASFIAGGSMPVIPKVEVEGFLKAAGTMSPVSSSDEEQFTLSNKNGSSIIYSRSSGNIKIDLPAGNYILKKIDTRTGKLIDQEEKINGGSSVELKGKADTIFWISKT